MKPGGAHIKRLASILTLLGIALLLAPPTHGQQASGQALAVDSVADAVDVAPGDGMCSTAAGECTLRAAIQETNALPGPDAINVTAGVYTLTIEGRQEDSAATGDLDITDDLTITGAGQEATIVDGNGIDRVFDVAGEITAGMAGLTLRGGHTLESGDPCASTDPFARSGRGGGICSATANLNLSSVTISGNAAATHGGGIFSGGALEISASIIDGNAAGGGGGIWSEGTLTLLGTTVSGNRAPLPGPASGAVPPQTTDSYPPPTGGGIVNVGSATLTNAVVTGNSAWVAGGIDNVRLAEITIAASTISDNSASFDGPGGLMNLGTASLTGTTVSGNTSAAQGGGIMNSRGFGESGSLSLSGVTLSGNSARWGAGIFDSGASVVSNTTISGNVATANGGGILNVGADLIISSTTVTSNQAPTGGGIFNGPIDGWGAPGQLSLTGSIVSRNGVGGNCIGPISSAGHNLEDSDACALIGPGDITAADPGLGPLADNGGPTWTHALLPESPAIDAGDNGACPTTDQRGATRPADGDGDGTATCDVGAYEFGPPETPTPAPSPSPTPSALPRTGGPGTNDPWSARLVVYSLAVSSFCVAMLGLRASSIVRRRNQDARTD